MDGELVRRAEAAGISVSYENWRHERVEVSAETIEALLAALDASASALDASASGASASGASASGAAPATPAGGAAAPGSQPDPAGGDGVRAPAPDRRAWGFTVQLYSVRSRDSWGHGDLHDLAELARWSGRELGAGFILVNPLHAAEPLPPVSPSPYLPMTRRYVSPLYLRVEDIPEYAALPAAERQEIEPLAAPLRALATSPELIDRDAVWTAKRAALERLFELPRSPERQSSFAAYRRSEGAELRYWTSWCALAERHGADWRRWPAPLRDREIGVAEAATGHGGAVEFHAWLQWLVDTQLAAAQRAALAAGMAHGVIHDLAVGVHPGGADAWAHQDLLVTGVSVGAPPDSFNQLGQDWAQPPWHPRRLAQARYRPLAELFGAAFRHAGGLRVDHVMGLTRLWWVPEGMTADRGAYVGYDHRAAVAALAGQAARSGGLAIGEDLGTVPGWLRGYLAGHDILGTVMLWFAQEPDGSPLRAEHWRRDCMATVGTHDVPTAAGFCTGAQVTERERLGLLTEPPDIERARAADLVAGWRDLLGATGLLTLGEPASPAELTVGLYGFLARTPAALIGVSLADAVGDSRSQNIPGTSTEYPNWRVPLCDQSGHPVLIEDLPSNPLVTAVTRAATPR
ncbi:MAG TPA: 4-alpha-glucanotransferase [Streptosporangiaceae bacterium]|jgi:4-alpha-glucanotransferase